MENISVYIKLRALLVQRLLLDRTAVLVEAIDAAHQKVKDHEASLDKELYERGTYALTGAAHDYKRDYDSTLFNLALDACRAECKVTAVVRKWFDE